jgi:hypothetical protein
MISPEELRGVTDFPSLIKLLRDRLEWEFPENLGYDQLTYSYTADELGLKIDSQVEITQLRPILGQQNPWGVFFVDFDKATLPVSILRRILSSVSRRSRESSNAADRALFDKNDLLFVSAFGQADDRKLALAHFHQDPGATALPTLRVLAWERRDTPRHFTTVAERLSRLRWPERSEDPEIWKARWSNAFIGRPRDGIRTAKEMATALAECARQIREAIQELLPHEREGQPLSLIFEAVKTTLNKDLDVLKFADTYAQTIAYGLLSKRIDQIQRWRAEKARTLNGDLPMPAITVDALETAILTNPFLSELLNSFLAAGGRDAQARLDFDELGLGDLVHLLNTANMEAVLDDFDKDKQGDDPVIHFYEGFLAAYDKAMKVQRGVFYTPKPVVAFIVRSVDEVLRTEFGLPLGLADTTTWGQFVSSHPATKIPEGAKAGDPFVKILDPATGTGTFLVEAIDLIHHRMMNEAWKEKPAGEKRQLWNAYVAEHLLPRLYGYELMMAPYAVAHMKISLKLADTGYDFSATEAGVDGRAGPARVRVFLTNALEPAQDLDMQLAFMNEALAHEARAANDAKARTRFTVVVGNPPYAGHSTNNNIPEIVESVRDYRKDWPDLLKPGQGKWLQDDYVKFLRFYQALIAASGIGLVGVITNGAYAENPTFMGMRIRFMEAFPYLQYLDLHGDVDKGDRDPLGGVDENVFKSGDVGRGVAVTMAARGIRRSLRRADLWGTEVSKLDWLSGHQASDIQWTDLTPRPPLMRLVNLNNSIGDIYDNFERLPSIFSEAGDPAPGFVTTHDEFAISFTALEQVAKVEGLLATDNEHKARALFRLCTQDQWSYRTAKSELPKTKWREKLQEVEYRPFDRRFTIFDANVAVHRRERASKHMLEKGALALVVTRQQSSAGGRWDHVFCAAKPAESTYISNRTREINYVLPLWLRAEGMETRDRPNLSRACITRLATLTDLQFEDGSDALMYGTLPGCEPSQPPPGATAFRCERGDLRTTFGARDVFDWIYAVLHSPYYRECYADFLKSDFARVPFPKDGDLFAALIALGTRLVALHLLDADALPALLTDPKARFVSNGGEPRLGRFNKEVRRAPSGRVYLNDQNWFATVPQAAWDHWIGGYQPAQKWLKDRSETGSKDKRKPGRLLTDEDILHYRRMIVALEETGKIMAEIDEVIERHGGWPNAFRGMID